MPEADVGMVEGTYEETGKIVANREYLRKSVRTSASERTGCEETEPKRQLCICGWSGLWGSLTETELRRRTHVGASARRNVEGELGDRHISRKQKGKVFS